MKFSSYLDAIEEFNCIHSVDELHFEDTQGLAYVAGYVLKKIDIPDCDNCKNKLFSSTVSNHLLLTSFKEFQDGTQLLLYASEYVLVLLKDIHDNLLKFLDSFGYHTKLEDNFKNVYKSQNFREQYCVQHDCDSLILHKCVTFLIFKYVKDRHKICALSKGHALKMQRFGNISNPNL